MKLVLLRTISITLFFFYSISNSFTSPTPASFAGIVEPLMPAVVNIYTTRYIKAGGYRPISPGSPFESFNEFFDNFDNPYQRYDESYSTPSALALGSGFIIDKTGYIVTNHHVVENADEIKVKLHDNTELDAKLIGSDKVTDLALLKVSTKKILQAVPFGDSDKTRIGDWVIAIGNPFGLGGTVTAGIISSKGRDLDTETGMVDDYIQTDAAINSGNSGGPMFNINGEVIGINTALISPSGTNIGIGFAIPSSTAKTIISKLKTHGKVTRGMLGVRIQEVTEEIAEGLGLVEAKGVLVLEVTEGSAAAIAGIKEGDIILTMNNTPVNSPRKLRIMVSEIDLDTNITLDILRHNKMQTITSKLTKLDDTQYGNISKPAITSNGEISLNNIIFANITAEIANKYNLPSSRGVIIKKLERNSSWKSLRAGDIITGINQSAISNTKDFKKAYDDAVKQKKKNIVFLIKRQNTTLYMALPLIKQK